MVMGRTDPLTGAPFAPRCEQPVKLRFPAASDMSLAWCPDPRESPSVCAGLRYRHPGASGDWLPGCGAPAARQTLEPTATLVLFSLNIRHFLANALVRARGHPKFHRAVPE